MKDEFGRMNNKSQAIRRSGFCVVVGIYQLYRKV